MSTKFHAAEAGARSVVFRPWPLALGSLGVGLLVLFASYFPTFLSMVQIWQRSETFTHGYLIFPISLGLIWRRRHYLLKHQPKPDWRGILVLAGLGLVWLLANVVDVLVIQQLAFIAQILALVWTVMGWQIVKEIAFPLGFLFFAVPVGEFLIPPLMNFTADFTVAMIELTGIPVYREGTFFSLPSGDWSVVEGCSGLRYLIASITLGCLYAYLSYRSLWRRLAFIALATFFPIIANGLRAYMIVMIAHFSDMKLALGVDHYIYGWVFFGIVMLILFWIGSFWQEGKFESEFQIPSNGTACRAPTIGAWLSSTITALAVLAVWPAYADHLRGLAQAKLAPVTLTLPQSAQGWQKSKAELTSWKPHYLFPDAEAEASYTDGKRQAKLYVLYYRTQAQGKELVNSQNVLIPQKHPVWQMPWEKPKKVTLAGQILKIREGLLKSSDQTLLVWRWNWVSDTFTASDPWAKLLEAKDKLVGKPKDAAGIVVAVECEDDCKQASDTLLAFTQAMLPHVRQMLERAAMERYK
ncbi:MAG: exosortase A [Methylohalobius sp.]